MAKRFVMFLAAVVLSLAMPVLMAGPAFALSSEEQGFVSGVNVERAKKGVPALAVADDLVTVARAHSAEMAAQGTIFHNPNLANAVTGWQVVGENVGMGPTVSSINSAFIASPKHYENFVDSVYTQIGVGVVIDAKGTIFVTQVFRQPLAARVVQAAPAPVAAKPAAAPAPVAAKPAAAPAPVAAKPAAVAKSSATAPATTPAVAAQPAAAAAPAPAPAPIVISPRLSLVLTQLGALDGAADRTLAASSN